MKVDAVGYAVGFSDFSPFNKAFKSVTGCTASEYRRISHHDVIN
jgi:AraC-like DNA-binding protein